MTSATRPVDERPKQSKQPGPEPKSEPRPEAKSESKPKSESNQPKSEPNQPKRPPTPPRDRLLEAAGELFYLEGVNVGVEALTKAAGVSKRTMYQLFGTKDELIAASLERNGDVYQVLILPEAEPQAPRERILYVFEQLDRLSGEPTYRGCPFVATAVELKDADHPASVVARTYKDALTDFFRAEAVRAGVADPETLARQLTIVFDGSGARAVVQGQSLEGLATVTAKTLIDAAGLH